MIGKKFNRWTVLSEASKPYYFLCECDCGTTKEVKKSTLLSGKSQSCGCLQREQKRAKVIEDSIGKKFGRATVKSFSHARGKNLHFNCTCDCGQNFVTDIKRLRSGHTTSCGCYRVEESRKEKEKLIKFREENEPIFSVDGTWIPSLTAKTSKASTTGVKGVSKLGDRYRAYITIRRKQIYLGLYDTLEEAAQARADAEERYFHPILDTKKRPYQLR